MSFFVFPALFLLVAGELQTTTEPAPQPDAAEPAPEATLEEPKMICRNKRVTGSRVAKERVCRPAGGTHNDLDAATQRDLGLNRNAPMAAAIGGGARDGVL